MMYYTMEGSVGHQTHIFCKCGHQLTGKVVRKVHHSEAYGIGSSGRPDSVVPGVYHRGRAHWLKDRRRYYAVNIDALSGASWANLSQGCCRLDSFDVRCRGCGEDIGSGANDCWTTESIHLIPSRVRFTRKKTR